eukprot:4622449-Pleurochrysis_carterae.AAC.1
MLIFSLYLFPCRFLWSSTAFSFSLSDSLSNSLSNSFSNLPFQLQLSLFLGLLNLVYQEALRAKCAEQERLIAMLRESSTLALKQQQAKLGIPCIKREGEIVQICAHT